MNATIEGTVRVIRYVNPTTFWTIASVRVRGQVSATTVVGLLPGLAVGMDVRVEGQWQDNARYGRQLKADRYTELIPATKAGLTAYLASGFVSGIGPKMAERLVERFGTDTVDVIMKEPQRLSEVSGLGAKRISTLSEAFRERRGAQEALVFLLGLGIGRGIALKIFKRYGDDTVSMVRRKPYTLAEDVHGIGFLRADQVARGLDIARDDPGRLRAGLYHCLRVARDEGHCYVLRRTLVAAARELLGVSEELLAPALSALVADGKVVLDDGPVDAGDEAVYLTRLFNAEQGAAQALAALLGPPDRGDTGALVQAAAARLDIDLAVGQIGAVEMILREGVSVVTGGPGTGKTTIIRTALEAMARPEGVALAAPTGRAAKRMTEATGQPAKTLHRLLEFSPQDAVFKRTEEDPLEVEAVIVDEASMIDLPLFYALLRALTPGTKLVLVGDCDQLPPVGPGSPLTDIIRSERVPVTQLTEIFRQGAGSAIVEGAHAINRGIPLRLTPADTPLQDLYFIRRDDPEHIRSTIEQLVTKRIPERFGLDPMRDVQVLSPMRSGPIGVEALNVALQALLNPPPPESPRAATSETRGRPALRVGDKVMQIRNDYDRNVFNGDVGFVSRMEAKGGGLAVIFDDREVAYDRAARDDLVLAYAVTVHKSQGSEYPAVVLPVSTHHYKMLRRNLLYTGLTRGKRLVVLVGTERAMRIAVETHGVEARHSQLGRRLGEAADGNLVLR